jgi:DNA-binding NtrC family response regulator
MRSVFGVLERIGPTRLSCVLLGETGTGKELAARGLHASSEQARGPFVVFDCGAVSESLAGAELFGHERGAFTGADRARSGAFELADGGTLFLDEIGDLPLSLQPKLLRAIERREIKRLGAEQPVDVDVRVISATHRHLKQAVEAGSFRQDLYYRLAEVEVDMPPLREHLDDVSLLVEQILSEEARYGAKVRRLSGAALQRLQAERWPGHVRELRNVIRRAVALAPGELLDVDGLGLRGLPAASAADTTSSTVVDGALPDELASLDLRSARERWNAEFERRYLAQLLERCEGDERRAATECGVHLKSLQRLLRQHGLRKG